jgi:hypothetical protein
MYEYDGLTPVELLKNRLITSVPQPLVTVTAQKRNPIRLEDIKSVLDLTQAALGVREGYYGKQTEAARVTSREIGCVFVRSACRPHRRKRISEPDTGRGKREDSRRDSLLVHCGDRLLRSPTQPSRTNLTSPRSSYLLAILREVKRWDEVMMHID